MVREWICGKCRTEWTHGENECFICSNMPREARVIGLIPARKGSKRVPGKNMALLGGKPLLQWTIEAAKASGVFDEIVVSTDWFDCAELAESLKVNRIIRPAALCTDSSHDYEWVKHALETFRDFDIFVILRPTSPFRTAETILRAMTEFLRVPCDSMRAVEKTKCHPRKSWVIGRDREYIYPFIKGDLGGFPYFDLATQSLGDVYCQNGCIHIAWTNMLEKYGNVSGDVIRPFFTEGREGHDINTPEDLEFAEWLIERGKA